MRTVQAGAQPAALSHMSRDRWLVALWIAALLVITAIPYIYGYAVAPAGRQYIGVMYGVADTMQYWSWMREHQDGLLVANRLTSEPNDPALFNVLWLILGRIQKLTGWSEAAMFQILRFGASAGFMATLWWFLGLLTAERRQRWASFAVITLGGGLGWVWVVDKYLNRLDDVRFPFDLYVAEPNTFFNILAFPHFLAAATLILLVFGCFLVAERGGGWRWYAAATAIALFLGVQHAYDLLLIYFVLGFYVLAQFVRARRILWGRFWGLGAVGILSFPPAGYFTYLTTQNPLWREILDQFSNAGVFTPNPLHLFILLGAPYALTIAYGLWLLKQRSGDSAIRRLDGSAQSSRLFLWTWAIVGFGLLYIPTDFQIHMLNPYQIPLAVLAVAAIATWTAARRRAARMSFTQAMLLLLLATVPVNLYLWSWRITELHRVARPFYLTQDEVAALNWLEARDAERAVVFSGEEIGKFVPALTDHRVVLGHWAMTAHFYERRDDVARFFAANTPAADRAAILSRLGARYVIYGDEERALGSFDPAADPALEQVFATPSVQIYAPR